jgi:hypothetical protein
MNPPDEPGKWSDPEPRGLPDGQTPDDQTPDDRAQGQEPLAFRVLRSFIAPPVLGDAGHDAPLSARGRLMFRATVAVLVLAIVVLFLVTVSSK